MYLHDSFTERIIGCAIAVHRALGPGLIEATYEEALCIELRDAGQPYVRQVGVPVIYKGHVIGEYQPDLVVGSRTVVEIKTDRLRRSSGAAARIHEGSAASGRTPAEFQHRCAANRHSPACNLTSVPRCLGVSCTRVPYESSVSLWFVTGTQVERARVRLACGRPASSCYSVIRRLAI